MRAPPNQPYGCWLTLTLLLVPFLFQMKWRSLLLPTCLLWARELVIWSILETDASSHHRSKPFISMHCASLSTPLLTVKALLVTEGGLEEDAEDAEKHQTVSVTFANSGIVTPTITRTASVSRNTRRHASWASASGTTKKKTHNPYILKILFRTSSYLLCFATTGSLVFLNLNYSSRSHLDSMGGGVVLAILHAFC